MVSLKTEDRPNAEWHRMAPQEIRLAIRSRTFSGPTAGLAPGYLQGNLVIVPKAFAADFRRYCELNPKPCPIIGICEPGSSFIPELGADLDLSLDIPAYRVFRHGERCEILDDLSDIWQEDFVAFVLGCSFSFEDALEAEGIPVRHNRAGRNVPMYRTSIATGAAGGFHGPLIVSMRAFQPADAIRAVLVSNQFPLAHGAPVHLADPASIGIVDLGDPDFGDPPVMEDGDIPVFWACGVTPQLALINCAPPIAITHEPGHMLITDIPAIEADSRIAQAEWSASP